MSQYSSSWTTGLTETSSALVRRVRRWSSGQMLPVFAGGLAVITGAVALSTDIGVFYYNQVTIQSAADAAALAGANYLPQYPTLAASNARTTATSDGMVGTDTFATSVSGRMLTVTITRTVPYYFGKVLGLSSTPIRVSSTAGGTEGASCVNVGDTSIFGTTTGTNPLLPIGVDSRTSYTYGSAVTLNQGEVAPGNWDPIALGGAGGSVLRQDIANGYQGTSCIGDWIKTDPGQKTGPLDQAFNDRITAGQTSDSTGTYSSHAYNDARIVIMPLVDWTGISGSSEVPIKGFMLLWLDSVNGATVSAHCIRQVAWEGMTFSSSAPDEGVSGTPTLLQ